jgi:hypothetical protein
LIMPGVHLFRMLKLISLRLMILLLNSMMAVKLKIQKKDKSKTPPHLYSILTATQIKVLVDSRLKTQKMI